MKPGAPGGKIPDSVRRRRILDVMTQVPQKNSRVHIQFHRDGDGRPEKANPNSVALVGCEKNCTSSLKVSRWRYI